MDSFSERALEHVEYLSVQIGSRPIGSPANRAAADYMGNALKCCSLSVERQEIPCPGWPVDQASVEFSGEQLEALANTFSPSCDVSAAIEPVCTLAELEAATITGRVLVFYGDMAQTELVTKGGIYVSEPDRRILQLLEKKKPAGIITINPILHARWRIIEDFDLEIPSATVSAQSGLKLLKRPGASAQMKITSRRSPGHTDNVVARLPGTIPQRFAFCAHSDSKVDTPGASDTAAGVGVLLTLAELLSKKRHRHTLEWIAFTGEEGAGLGDMEYASQARRTGNGSDQITTLINIDGVGPYTGTNTITSLAGSPEFEALIDQQLTHFPGVIRVDPWAASDHYIFYSNGTPCIALTSQGIRDIFHTLSDTFDWISGEKLAESVQLVLDLSEELDNKNPSWSRPRK